MRHSEILTAPTAPHDHANLNILERTRRGRRRSLPSEHYSIELTKPDFAGVSAGRAGAVSGVVARKLHRAKLCRGGAAVILSKIPRRATGLGHRTCSKSSTLPRRGR